MQYFICHRICSLHLGSCPNVWSRLVCLDDFRPKMMIMIIGILGIIFLCVCNDFLLSLPEASFTYTKKISPAAPGSSSTSATTSATKSATKSAAKSTTPATKSATKTSNTKTTKSTTASATTSATESTTISATKTYKNNQKNKKGLAVYLHLGSCPNVWSRLVYFDDFRQKDDDYDNHCAWSWAGHGQRLLGFLCSYTHFTTVQCSYPHMRSQNPAPGLKFLLSFAWFFIGLL